jgi:hypothetical protein
MRWFVLCCSALALAVTGFAAEEPQPAVLYVGGLPHFPGFIWGHLDLSDAEAMIFQAKGIRLEVPFAGVTALEAGHHEEHRPAGGALTRTVRALRGPRDRLCFTVHYTSNNKPLTAHFQLPSTGAAAMLEKLESRTHKAVAYSPASVRDEIPK